MLPTNTMRPVRRARIAGNSARVSTKGALRLTRNCSCQEAILVASMLVRAAMPALWMMASGAPKVLKKSSAARSSWSIRLASALNETTRFAPAFSQACAVACCRAAEGRPSRPSSAPRAAQASAVARPMPRLAPVIRTRAMLRPGLRVFGNGSRSTERERNFADGIRAVEFTGARRAAHQRARLLLAARAQAAVLELELAIRATRACVLDQRAHHILADRFLQREAAREGIHQ